MSTPAITYISPSYLHNLVSRFIFPDAVGALMPPGAPSAVIELRLMGGRLVEVEIPRWRIEELILDPRVVGEQLPLF